MAAEQVLELYAGSFAAYALVFVLGALFGSFANVCIYRMPPTPEHPHGRSVVRPGSHCSTCGHPVRWYDNVPILSYFWLRGRCRDCGAEFSPRYLLVEAMVAMLFVATYHVTVGRGTDLALALPQRTLWFVVLAAFEVVMVVIAFIDLDHKLILDKITYPAIPVFYGLGLLLPEHTWYGGLIGAAVGYLVVRLVADGYYHLTHREGMGYGDGKLLAIVGALHGWQAVVITLFFGSILGSVLGTAAILWARRREAAPEAGTAAAGEPEEATGSPDSGPDPAPAERPPLRHVELPFGPFLVVGAIGYGFVAPWLKISFGLLWGTGGGVL